MSQQPMVSIIIPIRKDEAYLQSFLHSLVKQRLSELEFLCVDDGASTPSLQIVRRMAAEDERIRLLRRQEGDPSAWQIGLDAAEGKYLYFTLPQVSFGYGFMEQIIPYAEYQTADLILLPGSEVDEDTGKPPSVPLLNRDCLPSVQPFVPEEIPNGIFQSSPPVLWNKLFKASPIREHGLSFGSLPGYEGLELLCCAFMLSRRILYLDQPMAELRIGKDATPTGKRPEDWAKALSHTREKLTSLGLFERCRNSFRRLAEDGVKLHSFQTPALSPEQMTALVGDITPKSPFFSIIAPVYKVEPYLRDCMDSLIAQSGQDIEIICVNDASPDGCLSILKEYAAKDSRIRIVDKPKNEGRMEARRSGVQAARGEYILFVDSDDKLLPDACKHFRNVLREHPVDILHGNTIVQNDSGNEKASKYFERVLIPMPLDAPIGKEELQKKSFVTRETDTYLWAKAIRTNIVRTAYEKIPPMNPKVGEDILLYFFFTLYAESYFTLQEPVYHYNYGIGISNQDIMSTEKFESYCQMRLCTDHAVAFLKSRLCTESASQACNAMGIRMVKDCFTHWQKHIAEEDRPAAMALLLKYWGDSSFFSRGIPEILNMSLAEFSEKYLDIPEYIHPSVRYGDGSAKPKVSVIIPVFNVKRYLHSCLDSICAQTLREIEIICVNDGSMDSSLAIAEEYQKKDERIAVISHRNHGNSVARNNGIRHAHGDYVYFMDSDDHLREDALEKLYAIAEEHRTDIVFFSAQIVYEGAARSSDPKYDTFYLRKPTAKTVVSGLELIESYLRKEDHINVTIWTQFFRKDFLSKKPFMEGIFHEDNLFSTLLLPGAERCVVCPEAFYFYLFRNDSITTQIVNHKHFDGEFVNFARFLAEAMSCKPDEKIKRDFLLQEAQTLLRRARSHYAALPEAEREKVLMTCPEEYRQLFVDMKLSFHSDVAAPVKKKPVSKAEVDARKYKRMIGAIKESPSYRIGMALTWAPRKARGFVRATREAGIGHAFRKSLQKLRGGDRPEVSADQGGKQQ